MIFLHEFILVILFFLIYYNFETKSIQKILEIKELYNKKVAIIYW